MVKIMVVDIKDKKITQEALKKIAALEKVLGKNDIDGQTSKGHTLSHSRTYILDLIKQFRALFISDKKHPETKKLLSEGLQKFENYLNDLEITEIIANYEQELEGTNKDEDLPRSIATQGAITRLLNLKDSQEKLTTLQHLIISELTILETSEGKDVQALSDEEIKQRCTQALFTRLASNFRNVPKEGFSIMNESHFSEVMTEMSKAMGEVEPIMRELNEFLLPEVQRLTIEQDGKIKTTDLFERLREATGGDEKIPSHEGMKIFYEMFDIRPTEYIQAENTYNKLAASEKSLTESGLYATKKGTYKKAQEALYAKYVETKVKEAVKKNITEIYTELEGAQTKVDSFKNEKLKTELKTLINTTKEKLKSEEKIIEAVMAEKSAEDYARITSEDIKSKISESIPYERGIIKEISKVTTPESGATLEEKLTKDISEIVLPRMHGELSEISKNGPPFTLEQFQQIAKLQQEYKDLIGGETKIFMRDFIETISNLKGVDKKLSELPPFSFGQEFSRLMAVLPNSQQELEDLVQYQRYAVYEGAHILNGLNALVDGNELLKNPEDLKKFATYQGEVKKYKDIAEKIKSTPSLTLEKAMRYLLNQKSERGFIIYTAKEVDEIIKKNKDFQELQENTKALPESQKEFLKEVLGLESTETTKSSEYQLRITLLREDLAEALGKLSADNQYKELEKELAQETDLAKLHDCKLDIWSNADYAKFIIVNPKDPRDLRKNYFFDDILYGTTVPENERYNAYIQRCEKILAKYQELIKVVDKEVITGKEAMEDAILSAYARIQKSAGVEDEHEASRSDDEKRIKAEEVAKKIIDALKQEESIDFSNIIGKLTNEEQGINEELAVKSLVHSLEILELIYENNEKVIAAIHAFKETEQYKEMSKSIQEAAKAQEVEDSVPEKEVEKEERKPGMVKKAAKGAAKAIKQLFRKGVKKHPEAEETKVVASTENTENELSATQSSKGMNDELSREGSIDGVESSQVASTAELSSPPVTKVHEGDRSAELSRAVVPEGRDDKLSQTGDDKVVTEQRIVTPSTDNGVAAVVTEKQAAGTEGMGDNSLRVDSTENTKEFEQSSQVDSEKFEQSSQTEIENTEVVASTENTGNEWLTTQSSKDMADKSSQTDPDKVAALGTPEIEAQTEAKDRSAESSLADPAQVDPVVGTESSVSELKTSADVEAEKKKFDKTRVIAYKNYYKEVAVLLGDLEDIGDLEDNEERQQALQTVQAENDSVELKIFRALTARDLYTKSLNKKDLYAKDLYQADLVVLNDEANKEAKYKIEAILDAKAEQMIKAALEYEGQFLYRDDDYYFMRSNLPRIASKYSGLKPEKQELVLKNIPRLQELVEKDALKTPKTEKKIVEEKGKGLLQRTKDAAASKGMGEESSRTELPEDGVSKLEASINDSTEELIPEANVSQEEPSKKGGLRQKLAKAASGVVSGVANILRGTKTAKEETSEEVKLETYEDYYKATKLRKDAEVKDSVDFKIFRALTSSSPKEADLAVLNNEANKEAGDRIKGILDAKAQEIAEARESTNFSHSEEHFIQKNFARIEAKISQAAGEKDAKHSIQTHPAFALKEASIIRKVLREAPYKREKISSADKRFITDHYDCLIKDVVESKIVTKYIQKHPLEKGVLGKITDKLSRRKEGDIAKEFVKTEMYEIRIEAIKDKVEADKELTSDEQRFVVDNRGDFKGSAVLGNPVIKNLLPYQSVSQEETEKRKAGIEKLKKITNIFKRKDKTTDTELSEEAKLETYEDYYKATKSSKKEANESVELKIFRALTSSSPQEADLAVLNHEANQEAQEKIEAILNAKAEDIMATAEKAEIFIDKAKKVKQFSPIDQHFIKKNFARIESKISQAGDEKDAKHNIQIHPVFELKKDSIIRNVLRELVIGKESKISSADEIFIAKHYDNLIGEGLSKYIQDQGPEKGGLGKMLDGLRGRGRGEIDADLVIEKMREIGIEAINGKVKKSKELTSDEQQFVVKNIAYFKGPEALENPVIKELVEIQRKILHNVFPMNGKTTFMGKEFTNQEFIKEHIDLLGEGIGHVVQQRIQNMLLPTEGVKLSRRETKAVKKEIKSLIPEIKKKYLAALTNTHAIATEKQQALGAENKSHSSFDIKDAKEKLEQKTVKSILTLGSEKVSAEKISKMSAKDALKAAMPKKRDRIDYIIKDKEKREILAQTALLKNLAAEEELSEEVKEQIKNSIASTIQQTHNYHGLDKASQLQKYKKDLENYEKNMNEIIEKHSSEAVDRYYMLSVLEIKMGAAVTSFEHEVLMRLTETAVATFHAHAQYPTIRKKEEEAMKEQEAMNERVEKAVGTIEIYDSLVNKANDTTKEKLTKAEKNLKNELETKLYHLMETRTNQLLSREAELSRELGLLELPARKEKLQKERKSLEENEGILLGQQDAQTKNKFKEMEKKLAEDEKKLTESRETITVEGKTIEEIETELSKVRNMRYEAESVQNEIKPQEGLPELKSSISEHLKSILEKSEGLSEEGITYRLEMLKLIETFAKDHKKELAKLKLPEETAKDLENTAQDLGEMNFPVSPAKGTEVVQAEEPVVAQTTGTEVEPEGAPKSELKTQIPIDAETIIDIDNLAKDGQDSEKEVNAVLVEMQKQDENPLSLEEIQKLPIEQTIQEVQARIKKAREGESGRRTPQLETIPEEKILNFEEINSQSSPEAMVEADVDKKEGPAEVRESLSKAFGLGLEKSEGTTKALTDVTNKGALAEQTRGNIRAALIKTKEVEGADVGKKEEHEVPVPPALGKHTQKIRDEKAPKTVYTHKVVPNSGQGDCLPISVLTAIQALPQDQQDLIPKLKSKGKGKGIEWKDIWKNGEIKPKYITSMRKFIGDSIQAKFATGTDDEKSTLLTEVKDFFQDKQKDIKEAKEAIKSAEALQSSPGEVTLKRASLESAKEKLNKIGTQLCNLPSYSNKGKEKAARTSEAKLREEIIAKIAGIEESILSADNTPTEDEQKTLINLYIEVVQTKGCWLGNTELQCLAHKGINVYFAHDPFEKRETPLTKKVEVEGESITAINTDRKFCLTSGEEEKKAAASIMLKYDKAGHYEAVVELEKPIEVEQSAGRGM